MFADGPPSQYLPVTYDVARVSCPVAIVYGGCDHLGRFGPRPRHLVPTKVRAKIREPFGLLEGFVGLEVCTGGRCEITRLCDN